MKGYPSANPVTAVESRNYPSPRRFDTHVSGVMKDIRDGGWSDWLVPILILRSVTKGRRDDGDESSRLHVSVVELLGTLTVRLSSR